MKKIFVFNILILQIFAYIDLGIQGTLYPILENNNTFSKILKESFKKNKNKIKKEVITAINKAFRYDKNLRYSKKDYNITVIDYSILQTDIYSPYTKQIIKHKGEKIIVPMPKGIEESFCLIDGKWDVNTTKKILKKLNKCNFYLVANKDIRKWAELYNKHNVYPYNEKIIKRWKLDKAPSKVILFDKYRKNIYLNYYKFKEKK